MTVDDRFEAAGRTLSCRWQDAEIAVAVAVVAPGAGSDLDAPFLAGVAEGLAAQGVSALRFNFPYREEGRGYPDRPPVLMDAWRGALAEAGRRAGDLPLVASGKSLGGRMATMVAAEDEERFPARAVVLFGYPLHAPGRPDKLRNEHLAGVRVPMLFIQGTRDPLATFGLISSTVRSLPNASLEVVEGADHSFRVKGARRPDQDIGRDLGELAASWIRVNVNPAKAAR
jgi:predicted alpha/beta-hydrolase family hydrolase